MHLCGAWLQSHVNTQSERSHALSIALLLRCVELNNETVRAEPTLLQQYCFQIREAPPLCGGTLADELLGDAG